MPNRTIKHILLALSGSVLLSLPWLGIAPGWILLIAWFPFLLLEDEISQAPNNNPYQVFNLIFLGSWCWHVITVWWVVKVSAGGIILLSVLNSLCMALVWHLFHHMKKIFSRQLALLALISLWISFEYFHHRWEIEWPWLCLGNGLASTPKIIQWYELTGMLGGTLWILLSNLLLFSAYKKLKSKRYLGVIGRSFLWLILIFVPLSWSLNRYKNYEEQGDATEFVLLQPNVDPFTEKFDDLNTEAQINRLVHLSDSLIDDNTSFVIGPETCLPELEENDKLIDSPALQPVVELARKHPKIHFILGAITRQNLSPDAVKPVATRFDANHPNGYVLYNSALFIDSATVNIYHKHILVAGVEKMPFERYFSFLKNLSLDLGGTSGSLGTKPADRVFTAPKTIAPIICFESMFGQYVSNSVKQGADYLAVITNDGWLDHSSGYRQHNDVARIRAIETRRSIARSANTGISSFINQRGDIMAQTNWDEETGLKATLYSNTAQSFYLKYGDYLGRICAFMASLLLLYFLARKMKRA